MSTHNSLLLGETLTAAGALSADQLRIALVEQRRQARPLGRLLVELGFLSEATLRDTLAECLGTPPVDLDHIVPEPEALSLLPRDEALRMKVFPLHIDNDEHTLTVAFCDQAASSALAGLLAARPVPLRILPRIAGEAEIEQAINRHYGHDLSIDSILAELESGIPDRSGNGEQPVIRLIDALLADAVHQRASDIHFEPEAGFLRIRYRIDGLLRHIRAFHICCWPGMSVRLKVVAGMNIAEMRAPQDGRFSRTIAGRRIDFRVASQPVLHGENIVLRLLDREKGILPLTSLGLNTSDINQLQRLQARPEGIILITGPTGSGKTTSLYSLLQLIDSENIHVMTLEDPVEYPLPRLRQTSLSDGVRMDFVSGIRSMMRQDPDVILVGEIRDAETATMAFRAAMTGHQVYSTLHANSALGALPRLLDLSVSPEILAGNLSGVIAQRLVRRLCPHCRQARKPSPAEQRLFSQRDCPDTLFHATGCPHCAGTGFRGRLALMEILRVEESLETLIAARAEPSRLRPCALASGYRPLRESGLDHVAEGHTSLAELARVIDLDLAG